MDEFLHTLLLLLPLPLTFNQLNAQYPHTRARALSLSCGCDFQAAVGICFKLDSTRVTQLDPTLFHSLYLTWSNALTQPLKNDARSLVH